MTNQTPSTLDEILYDFLASTYTDSAFVGDKLIRPEGAIQDIGGNIKEAEAKINQLFEEALGENDTYSEMCEYCSGWDDGRNDLREEQRSRWYRSSK